MEIEITFNSETGEVFLSRDHLDLLAVANELSGELDEEILSFFKYKPIDIDGRKNYQSFCG